MGIRDTAYSLAGRALGAISRMTDAAATAVGGSALATDSPRAKKLSRFADLYWGDQYEGRGLSAPWDKQPKGRYVALRDQKPSTQYDLPRLIVDRPTAMLFGEGRFPELTLEPAAIGTDVKDVNKWLSAICDEGNLEHIALAWARQGAALGTAVMTWCIAEGEFEFEPHLAYQCKPTFHPKKRNRLIALEKRYKFKKEVEELSSMGVLVTKTYDFWHREEWTATEHIVYEDALAQSNVEPVWVIADSAPHATPGKIPAVWVKNLDDGDASDIDGVSLLEGISDITEDIDRTISQKSRAVRYNQDPERVYFGLNDEQGKKISGGAGATTMLPQKPGADVMLLEMKGDGQKLAEDHVVAQRSRGLETARVVAPDPERLLAAAKSAVAMRILFSPMLEMVGELRTSYGRALREILGQILEAARAGTLTNVNGEAVRLVTPPPDSVPLGKPQTTWGKFFQPTPDDLVSIANAVVALKRANILDDETIIRAIATYFDVKDVQHVLDKVNEQKQEQLKQQAMAFGPLGAKKPSQDPNVPPDQKPKPADATDQSE